MKTAPVSSETTPQPFSTRLEEAYRLLPEPQKRNLARFLGSSYLIRDKNLLPFHHFLSRPITTDERYDKIAAWKFVFGKAAFSEKKFRYLISDLLAAIEDFIYFQQVLGSKPGYFQYLRRYYTLHGAAESQSALAGKIKNKSNTGKFVIAPDHFLEKHFENELLEELHTISLKSYRNYAKESRNSEPTGLDSYYTIEKLRQMCRIANDNNVFGLDTRCFNEPDVIKLAGQQKINANFFVLAYLNVYELLTQRRDESFYKLKKLLARYVYDMDENSMAELLTYARNFCIARINEGQSAFFGELFDLYQQGLKNGSLLPNGEINERNFKNIVTTALRTGKHEWALYFIENYRYRLNKVVRENAFNYNMANYFFHISQYDKGMHNLQKVQLADLFYGLDARSLMIKCYYELGEKEAFMNAYFSFRIFVQRRKNVSRLHQKFYFNFLRISKKLMNLRPSDRRSVQKLNDEIKASKALADKNWLEEKLKVFMQ